MYEINYFTDGSIAWDSCCAGYVILNKILGQSIGYVVKVSRNNIHLAEIVAIKLALIDIYNNYDPNNTYNIYTDSDEALRLIKIKSNRYSEISEINIMLKDLNHKVNLYLVKSHTNENHQMDYFYKNNNKELTRSEAIRIVQGNRLIDTLVNSETKCIDESSIYNSTPFIIKQD